MKILVFDNYDSFTYNLVHLVEKITRDKVEVHRNDKIPLEKVLAVAGNAPARWTMAPENTVKFVEFMHAIGTIKEKSQDWKDLFFPEIHDLPGS